MARARMVTRTIKSTEVTVLQLDTVSAEPSNATYIVPCNIPKEKTLDYLRKNYDTDVVKVVSIVKENPIEKQYGMTETDFIKLAKTIEK